jgi:chromosome segregation ATPase
MTRSRERKTLAEAIGKFNGANTYHDRVAEALATKEAEVISGWIAVSRAEADIASAREREGARLVEAHDPGRDQQELSLAEAEDALLKVNKDLVQARTDRDTLTAELSRANTRIAMARPALQRTVRAVVTAEGGVLALKARYEALRAQAAAMEQALNLVSFALPPNPLHIGPVIFGGPLQRVESPLEAALKRALVALESDPDAPLPAIP